MSTLSFDWHVSPSVADAHKGVVLTDAANQRKVEESNTKTKEHSRPSWWPQWQEPFAQFPWGTEGGEGPWNSEQKSIGDAHVPCLSPPSTALLYNLCRRGFYFCVYFFFICVCTLFVWWDKDRKGEAGGLGQVDKTSLAAVTNKEGLISVGAVARYNTELTFTMSWGKLCGYQIVSVLRTHRSLGTRTCSRVSVSQNAILRNVTYLCNIAILWPAHV